MASKLASSTIDRKLYSLSNQTKSYKIGIYYFYA